MRLAARHCILQALTVVDARANDISACGAGFFAEIEIWIIFLVISRLKKTLKAVIKKAVVISRGSVSTGGPTASMIRGNRRVPRAGVAPNPDEPLVPVPVPGGVGCFRAL